jgi:hypothetical protein
VIHEKLEHADRQPFGGYKLSGIESRAGAGLPAAVRVAAMHHGEHNATRVCAGAGMIETD